MRGIIISLVILMILIVGCGQSEPTFEPTPGQTGVIKPPITNEGVTEEQLLNDNLDEALNELDQLQN